MLLNVLYQKATKLTFENSQEDDEGESVQELDVSGRAHHCNILHHTAPHAGGNTFCVCTQRRDTPYHTVTH